MVQKRPLPCPCSTQPHAMTSLTILLLAHASSLMQVEPVVLQPFEEKRGGRLLGGHSEYDTRDSRPRINQDLKVDFGYCFDALALHDDDKNLRLDQEEFFDFARDFGGVTECLGSLTELPLELAVVFNQLACECRRQGDEFDCCIGKNAFIPVDGASFGYNVNTPGQDSLRQVCLRTDQAIISFCASMQSSSEFTETNSTHETESSDLANEETRMRAIIYGVPFIVLLGILALCRWIPNQKERYSCSKRNACGASSFRSNAESSCDNSTTGQWIERDVEKRGRWIFTPLDCSSDEKSIEVATSVRPEGEGAHSFDLGRTFRTRTLDIGDSEDGWREPATSFFHEYQGLSPNSSLSLDFGRSSYKADNGKSEGCDLEHYVPDGGVVMYEKGGVWKYLADGGWVLEERSGIWNPSDIGDSFKARKAALLDDNDNRKNRTLRAYDGAEEVFLRLQEDGFEEKDLESCVRARRHDISDWVVKSALDSLDCTLEERLI